MIPIPPSERWVRLRHWLGDSTDQIVGICTRMGLPGYAIGPEMVVTMVLAKSPHPPKAPHLREMRTPAGRGRRRKPDPLAWVLHSADTVPSPEEYAATWRLDHYLQSPGGRETVKAAVQIWNTPTLRSVACAGLLASVSTQDIARYLRRYAPKVMHPMLRKVDVLAFEDLFWDFRERTIPERADFMSRNPATFDYHIAVHCGFDAYLRQIGLVKFEIDRAFFRTEIKELSAAWLRVQKTETKGTNPFALASLWNTVSAVLGDEDRERAAARGGIDADLERRIEAAYVRVSKPQPLPHLSDLQVLDIETTQLREDVDQALDMGAITESEAQSYYIRIDLREPVGLEIRSKIAALKTQMSGAEDPLAQGPVSMQTQRRPA